MKLSPKDASALQKAKNYCFLLLKFRARSEKEIYSSLKRKKFDEEIIRAACKALKNNGFIDDNAFTKAWIAARLKKPLGLERIKQELKLKGIADSVLESNIEEIRGSYSQEDTILKVVKAKLSKFSSQDPDKIKKKLFGYLLRRGFSAEKIIDIFDNNRMLFREEIK
jgi:regulatory protein